MSNLKTENRKVDPRTLKLLEVNARYMTGPQLDKLVENIRRDGCLTSMPLCYQHTDGTLEVLSGNHRVEAAIKAELAEVEVMVIVSELSRARRTALQLAHNSITGQDDANLLLQLYEGLDLDEKKYSGVTDDMFKGLKELDIEGMGIGSVKYDELKLLFLPEEQPEFVKAVERLKKEGETVVMVAPRPEFERLFDTIIAVKRWGNIINAGTAITIMVELATQRLDQLMAEKKAEDDKAKAAQPDAKPAEPEAPKPEEPKEG